MNIPDRPVRPLFSAVTPIRYPNQNGHGTGFFFSPNGDGNETYLITNHHVVSQESGDPISDSIRIVLRPTEKISELEHYDIDLIEGDESVWLEHPAGPNVDVVAIPLSINLDNYVNHFVTKENFLPDDVIIEAGEEAMIIGYPILGTSPYLPLIRSALISSPYGTAFEGNPCFATDANMHSGTSGSPVFTLPTPFDITENAIEMSGPSFYFIGVHSATLYSDHEANEGPLNLNMTWYAELLRDIIGF